MTDFFTEVFQTINDRFRNKVFGPFFIAFTFWNWKPILLIFSSNKPIEETILNIQCQGYFNVSNILIYPLIISLLYSIIQPFLSLYLGNLIKWPIKKGIQSNNELKKERKKGEVDLAHLEFEIQDAKAGTLKIGELNDERRKLEDQNKIYVEDNQMLRKNINELETKTFKLSNSYKETRSNYSTYLLELIQSRYSDTDKWEVVKALELIGRGNVDLDEISNEVKNDLINFKIIQMNKEAGSGKLTYFLTPFGQLFLSHLNFK